VRKSQNGTKLAQPLGDRGILRTFIARWLKFGRMALDLRYRDRAAVAPLAVVFACLISISAFAQGGKKLVFDKWRPKDGFYIVAGIETAGLCEDSAQYFFELSKKRVTDHVSFGCRVIPRSSWTRDVT
jgi:hypothetical protein